MPIRLRLRPDPAGDADRRRPVRLPTWRVPGLHGGPAGQDGASTSSSSSSSSAGPGLVGQSLVYLIRSTNNGATWSAPTPVDPQPVGHQFFPDLDLLDGTLAVMWQDSRTDPAYSVQHPIGNTSLGFSCGC